ncbi:GNAT family N-acetyltransferase [Yoonia sp. 208BN28-4]|uniref:GNAT family N-acetyltransferase n=1 Tax=Yoonia sp. 208BN28-4 TaxID=3126505 RepID=UPI0030A04F6E
MTVRPANPRDNAAIRAIVNALIRDTTVTFAPDPKSHDDISRIIDGPCFVAEVDGKVQGYAAYFPFRPGAGYARTVEYSIVLTQAGQGRGLGRALLDQVCHHARSAGKTTVVAGISGENTAGLAFHRAMGFEQTGHLPAVGHKFGRDIDLVIAQKRL